MKVRFSFFFAGRSGRPGCYVPSNLHERHAAGPGARRRLRGVHQRIHHSSRGRAQGFGLLLLLNYHHLHADDRVLPPDPHPHEVFSGEMPNYISTNDREILIQCQIYQTSYVPRLSVPSLQYFVPPFQFYDLSLRPSVNEEEDVLIDDSNEEAGPGPSGNADQGRNSNCVSRAQLKIYDIIC